LLCAVERRGAVSIAVDHFTGYTPAASGDHQVFKERIARWH
jgi:hypothetical protein